MERPHLQKLNPYLTCFLSTVALTGCNINDLEATPEVQCDGKEVTADFSNQDRATFVVHGKNRGDVAAVQVLKSSAGVSVAVEGTIIEPPHELEMDDFTEPVPLMEGSEVSTFAAGEVWVIDAREDTVVVQGTCDGM
jgi:hypothetical protein